MIFRGLRIEVVSVECTKMKAVLVIGLALVASVKAGTNCFSVKGKLECKRDEHRAADAEIYLMDDDGALNNDDRMGWTTSNEDGTFRVEGCGYDFTTTPDPYLRISNICNGDHVISTRVTLPYKFQPEVIDAGIIKLDMPA